MPEPSVVAFLSSGRCGTRWLADGLHELYPELEVEHEPIGPLYKPRLYFRRYEDPGAILEVPEVRSHIARIVQPEKVYVETGWPLFAALPLLAELLGYRLRVVYLTRHPVASALAHLADNAYAGSERDDDYTRLATLGPRDGKVFQPHYAATWHHLSPYEKCLFWWTEVNLFGLELPGRMRPTRFIRIKAEEMLTGERSKLEPLLRFLELPWDERWRARARVTEEGGHYEAGADIDPLEVHRHPAAVDTARELGYDLATLTRGERAAGAVSS